MRRISTLLTTLLIGGALALGGCDSSGVDGGEKDEPLETIQVQNLPADPDTTSGPGRPQGYGRYTFFDLRDDEIVLRSPNDNRADSASTEWDIAFQSVDIIVNGGSKGPGQGAAYMAKEPFQEVTEANADSLTHHTVDAMKESWYSYNANGNNIVRPKPGRTIVVRTADGESYAKIRIQSYYEGAPDDPAESDAESRYYTFEYVLQDEGTSFE